MPKQKRSRSVDLSDVNESSDSDGGFVREDDDGRKKKKARPSKLSSKSGSGSASTNIGVEPHWELSSSARAPRRATISEFKNSCLVSIREYFENSDGKLLPTKKGISLTIDQYNKLLKAIPHINAKLLEMGENIDGSDGNGQQMDDEDGVSLAKRAKVKSQKSNIEATSDENED